MAIAVGLEKGHQVTKLAKREKPSYRKGKQSKKARFTRDLVKEIVGFAPYEKRILELLKIQKDKRALKFTKKRIGGHSRAKRVRENMNKVIRQQRKK